MRKGTGREETGKEGTRRMGTGRGDREEEAEESGNGVWEGRERALWNGTLYKEGTRP